LIIDRAMERDAAAASAEYMAQFRTDAEGFLTREAVEACINVGVRERPPERKHSYIAFVDPSGESSDAMTLAIAHKEGETEILDVLRERKPPFSPETVTEEYASLVKKYRCTKGYGDRYGGEWPREQFRKHGVNYEPSKSSKSELYVDLLPFINSGAADLLDNDRLMMQLTSLERRTSRAGRDSIDHSPGAHDDLANRGGGCVGDGFQRAAGEELQSQARTRRSGLCEGEIVISREEHLAKHVRFIAEYEDGSEEVFAVPQATLDQGPGALGIARIVAGEWQREGHLKPGAIVRVRRNRACATALPQDEGRRKQAAPSQ
jgi:hypothetical protein